MRVRHAALSDIGLMRNRNEDRLVADDACGLYGVADGVGGLPFGEEAARLVLEVLKEQLSKANGRPTTSELLRAVHFANTRVHREGLRLNPSHGIATTLTLGIVDGSDLYIVHVGDSRCYVWRGGRITQATVDHNVESDPRFVLRREMQPDVLMRQSGALTRCIGQNDPLEVESHLIELEPGDRVLFCTDGLFRQIPEHELGEELAAAASPEAGLKRLVKLANERGGADNATGVLLFVE